MTSFAMATVTNNHWFISFPLDVGSLSAALAPFRAEVAERGGDSVAVIADLAMPSLKVGTLDSLMALGDELVRTDAYVEGVWRKAERQVTDSHVASKLAEAAKSGGHAPAIPPLGFRVGSTPLLEYLRHWAWDRYATSLAHECSNSEP